jgi:hypothetical protein
MFPAVTEDFRQTLGWKIFELAELAELALPLCFSALPNQIAAAFWSHLCRVHRACWHIASTFGSVRLRAPIHRQCHFSAQNNVRGFRCVRMLGIIDIRSVLPDKRVSESFIHGAILTRNAHAPKPVQDLHKRLRPFRSNGGCREKGVPSSGEKTAETRPNYSVALLAALLGNLSCEVVRPP